MVGVEQDAEVVTLGDGAVAHLLAWNDPGGVRVVAIRENANLRPLGDGLALVQLALTEAGEDLGVLPGGVVESPIDDGRRSDEESFRGKFLKAWRLDSDGVWRIRVDSWSPAPGP